MRILVVQLADIGDLILSTPALAALREAHPDSHIAVLTTAHAAPILSGAGIADAIIPFDKHTFDSPRALLHPANLRRAFALALRLRRERPDAVLMLHHFSTRFGALKFAALAAAAGSRRVIGLENGSGFFLTERLPDDGFGARHQAQYWLDVAARLGASPHPRRAVVGISADDRHAAEALLSPLEPARPIIAIHAGSGGYSLARRWDARAFAEVADALTARHQAQIVLVGGAGDDTEALRSAMHAPALDLSGRTSLSELAAVLARCQLFLGADSGVMHLAAAVGTPIVALFGPSNPKAWSPWTPDGISIVVRSAPACSPCSYIGTQVGLRGGCAARTCMRMVTATQVITACERALRGEAPPHPAAQPAEAEPGWQRIHLLGLPVDGVTYDDWLRLIDVWIAQDGDTPARQVCTINPEFMMVAQRDVNFRNILRRAALCVPDGAGLLWAARMRGTPLPERVTGSDGVPRIAAQAAARGWRLFLLGAAPGIAARAADVLRAEHPTLHISGVYSGSPAPHEEDALVERVNASGADILLVAFGAPEQDKWIARNLPRLKVRMAMGVGGTFDFIAGVVPRAPVWMRRMGIEWLFRLLLQPWRFRRMLRLPRFVWAVLMERLHPRAAERVG